MVNPFCSEARAFRFLLAVLAYCVAVVVAASVGGFWPALIVFAGLGASLLAWWVRAGRAERTRRMSSPPHPPGERRILVIANETLAGDGLRELLGRRALGRRTEVLVIAPALNSPLRHWASDEDDARASARRRLAASLEQLRALGIRARGQVGDADPLQAIEDGLRGFAADEIVVSTHPPDRSNWLEQGAVERARARFAVPLTHLVVRPASWGRRP